MFRQAWGNFATGAALITTIEQDGVVHGMTANGIASISLDPMLVMVSVGHKAKTHPIIIDSGRYGINILGDHSIFIGEVESIEVKSGSPLIFFNGKWALLAD